MSLVNMLLLPLVMGLAHAHAVLPRYHGTERDCTTHRSYLTTVYSTAPTSTWTPGGGVYTITTSGGETWPTGGGGHDGGHHGGHDGDHHGDHDGDHHGDHDGDHHGDHDGDHHGDHDEDHHGDHDGHDDHHGGHDHHHGGHGGHGGRHQVTTVYQTVYSTFCPVCPQGLGPATYTLTQVCPGGPGSPCRPSGDICPPGFTKTVSVCDDCGEAPITATLTLPCPEQTTVYTTEYPSFCPTGFENKTYTVTQVCREQTCEQPPVGTPPPGFNEVVDVCNTCGPSPITATLTIPAGQPSDNGQIVATKPLGPAEVPAQPTETYVPAANPPPAENPPPAGNPNEAQPTGVVYVAGAVTSPAIGIPVLLAAFCIPGILFRIAF